jgi:hypothetical protein
MPNPLMLVAMGVSLSEYNSYSNAKKARFQKQAIERVAKASANPNAYDQLTRDVITLQAETAENAVMDALEDEEKS